MAKAAPRIKLHPLIINFFDVGHGEAILIQFPDCKTLGVIDCHADKESNRIALKRKGDCEEPKLLSYLRELKTRSPMVQYEVAFICLSHFHDDHFSGMAKLVAGLRELKIPVREFWDAGISPKKVEALAKECTPEAKKHVKQLESLYRELDAEVDNGLIPEFLTNPLSNFKQYGDVKLELLAPAAQHWQGYLKYLESPNKASHANRDPLSADENVISSVIRFEYKQATALLTGDVPNEGWSTLFTRKADRLSKLQLVKSSHHGSRQGNFLSKGKQSIWERVSEEGKTVAVISGGYRRALPHEDTIRAMQQGKVTIFCTGDYRQRVVDDPIDKSMLPEGVIDIIKYDSTPTLKLSKPLHGDIAVFLFPNGKTKVNTEFQA